MAVTKCPRVVRRLAISWGVAPLLCPGHEDDAARIQVGAAHVAALGLARSGDLVVATAGIAHAEGSTNLIRVIRIG